MCGICGIAFNDHGIEADENRIQTMMGMLAHRGPDEEGLIIKPGAALGFRRLSIIDLETGNQPFSNEDGIIFTVCNGEIYNYKELRSRLAGMGHRFRSRSDSEVIVHLYEEYGLDFVKHLQGMFAIALWDSKKRELLLARDRFGIKPLHYAVTGEGILFASEQKAILVDPSVERDIDGAAMESLFSFGFVTGDQTLFRGVRRVPPAALMRFNRGQISRETYWQLDLGREPDSSEQRMTERDWVQMVRESLAESVKSHLMSDVPVAAWLSPGIDSSAIVTTMRRLGHMPAETFSLRCDDPSADEIAGNPVLSSFPGFEDIPNKLVTLKRSDLNLMGEAVWHGEEPFTSATEIASMILSRACGGDYKVVLTGEGSDEVFGGYSWYRAQKVLTPFLPIPHFLREIMIKWPGFRNSHPGAAGFLSVPDRNVGLSHFQAMLGCPTYHREKHLLFSSGMLEVIQNGEPADLERDHVIAGKSGFRSFQACDMNYRLSNVITHHLDRSSMSRGLEARVPFLDHVFVERCARIPDHLKLKMMREKHILREAMKGDLPAEILRRRKRPMGAPFAKWLTGDLPEVVSDSLSSDSLSAAGYFNPLEVQRYLREHQTGRVNHGRILTGIIGIQVWDRVIRKM